MEREIFFEKHSEIVNKYNISYTPDCDYAALVSGCNYYDNLIDGDDDDCFITHISGITIGDNEICGDVDGYLDLLLQTMKEYREDPIEFKNS